MFAILQICFLPLLFTVVDSKLNTEGFRKYLTISGHDLGSISRVEKLTRYRLFAAASKYVEAQNQLHAGYTSTLNKFAVMTPAERALYRGVNRTESGAEETVSEPLVHVAAPSSVSWVDKGHVTAVKDQGGCGACWTFGPAVAIEAVYKQVTGKLKQFSNQELLDCAYGSRYNGCNGGFETQAFSYLIKTKRLALLSKYPYEPADKTCRSAGKGDGLKAAKVVGYTRNDGSEAGTIARLAQGPLSVAFHVVSSIYYYKTGIYRSRSCRTTANHAVAAVAYTPTYILIKNSWGGDWGDQGLFKFARRDTACGIHKPDNNLMVQMKTTGMTDNDPEDAAMVYDQDAPVCYDKRQGCLEYFCDVYSDSKTYCMKTCGYC